MIVTSLLQYLTFLLGSELLFLLPQSPKVYLIVVRFGGPHDTLLKFLR